jgi:hypothetical protein
MIFEIPSVKCTAMKKSLVIILLTIFVSACSTTKEANSSSTGDHKDKNLAEQDIIKKTVESRRFVIKLERLYYMYGGTAELKPRANYIIIYGDKAVISAAYIGRQFDIKPITGINMRGETMNYELTRKVSKGMYEIKTQVTNGKRTFDLIISVGKNGSCNATLSSINIDNISYRGYIVPIKENPPVQDQNGYQI